MSQRSAAVLLKIPQPPSCKNLKDNSDIENAAIANENTERKGARSGKDGHGESALKICLVMFVKRIFRLMGLLCVNKQKNLLKLWSNKS
jgi:hypothetical protein